MNSSNMKKIVLFLFFITHNFFAQTEMTTTTGVINFEASVPFYEEVTATNKTVFCSLDLKKGAITTEVKMKEFRFKLSLMEEHFNKKYLETDRHPKANFKGTIEGFNSNIIDNNPKEFIIKGELKIHGKTKKITTKAFLKKVENGLEIISDFKVNTKDFNIQIPEIFSMKVAETVNVKFYFFVK
jgi:polyisoprenoid-binding protein YceI